MIFLLIFLSFDYNSIGEYYPIQIWVFFTCDNYKKLISNQFIIIFVHIILWVRFITI